MPNIEELACLKLGDNTNGIDFIGLFSINHGTHRAKC
jgi:hypothetical protein